MNQNIEVLKEEKTLRVLHVLTGLGSGGPEKWVVDVISHLDKDRFQNVILVFSDNFSLYKAHASRLNIPVIVVPISHNFLKFTRGIWEVLKSGQPFDVVHSHTHYFSSMVLTIAKFARVPIRIAHAHGASKSDSSIWRRLYARMSKRLISYSATCGIGVSKPCAQELFGLDFYKDSRWLIVPCGIPLDSFGTLQNRDSVAKEMRISPDAFVIIQVGRLDFVKNQEFSLKVFASLDIPNAVLLLLGEGQLESYYRKLTDELGIAERVVFAGVREDIPRILCAIADLFIMPSISEGSPIALIEAQAAAIPCIISEGIPASSIVIPNLVEQIPLEAGINQWKRAIEKMYHAPRQSVSISEAVQAVSDSPFNIKSNCSILAAIYSDTKN